MTEKGLNPIEEAMGGRCDFNTIAAFFLTVPFGCVVMWSVVSKLVSSVITLDTPLTAVFFLGFGFIYILNFGLIFGMIRGGLDRLNPAGHQEPKENYKDTPPDDQGPD